MLPSSRMQSRVAQSIQLYLGESMGWSASVNRETKVQCQAGEVEIGQISDGRMLEDIIGVVENGNGEVGRIAERYR